MVTSPNVDAIRAQIPGVSSLVYLNCGWQGPSPQSVIEAVRETFELEAGAPTAPPVNERRLETFRRARRLAAELIGASPEEVTLQQNTTEGINIVTSGLALSPGDEVVTCSLEHASMIVPFYYTRERRGVTCKVVRLSARDSDAEVLARMAEAITPATKLVMLSQLPYVSGRPLPAREIAALAHEAGAYVLLDSAQTVGQMPVDVRELDCDFLAFPGHKWLLGPAATGALYVRSGLIERLESPKVAHRASESYDFRGRFKPKGDSVDKFELTTVSVPLLAGFVAAIEFMQGIGLEVVRDRCRELGRYATRRLARIQGIRFVSPANEEAVESGMVSFSLPDVAAEVLTACLWERGRVVARTAPDARCTRLCMHVYNTEQEVDAALDIVEEVARDGAPAGAHPTVAVESQTMMEL
ncbi:MAG: aminotransferase class V-fold PLP-dependent enzyme [Dehalococcoidia bacterium]